MTSAELARAAATGSALTYWASVQGDELAIQSSRGERTFAELDANINRLVRVFRDAGLEPGDAVAIVLTNRPEYAEVVHACLRAGLRYTPVNWHLKAAEVAYIVTDCEAKAVVGDAQVADLLAEVASFTSQVACHLAVGGDAAGFDSYEGRLAAMAASAVADPSLGSRMLYTSGTTGRPKGVVRPPSYSTGLAALTTAPRYAAGTDQRNLCTGPLYHGGPHGYSMTVPLALGIGIVVMERWDAATALELIEQHRITHTHMVPTMFHRLLRLPRNVRQAADVSSMQYLLHGAAPCPVETKRAMIDWFGAIIWEYFAATEGAGASISSQEWLERPGSVGLPPSPGHIRILDDRHRAVSPGTAGEICFRRDEEVSFSYFKDDGKTDAAIRPGGYASVGDIGYLDDAGYLFVTDRDAEIIVSGGVNIYPAEIEAVLLGHPAVRDAAIIGIPDEEWGEQVKAIVEVDASEPTLEAELIQRCRDALAHFKCPRTVEVTDKLPRLDNGKLYRHELRERYR